MKADNMEKIYGGIEGGGTKFVCAIGTGDGKIVEETRIPTTTPGETMAKVAAFFKEQELKRGKIAALGFACFGPIDPRKDSPTYGNVLPTAKPGWSNADVLKPLRDALDCPISFDTDVNGAALGEWTWGQAQGLNTFIYVTVGTGIGGGAYVEGRLLHGLLHPEMGHIPLPHDKNVDPFEGDCPFHGDCFEGLASGVAMEKRWGKSGAMLGEDHPAWDLEADYIARAICAYTYVISPQRIILGGGVGQLPHLLGRVQKRIPIMVNGYIKSALIDEPEKFVVAPGLGGISGAVGAIALAKLIVK